ncbi:MAG TPA: hypothetical protein VIF10_10170 [Methylobacter sp.]|jgi:hypothetical protein
MSLTPVLHDSSQTQAGYQALKDKILSAILDSIPSAFCIIYV